MEGVSSQQWKAYHRNKEIARHPDAEELRKNGRRIIATKK
jgi:hypothetical protein